MKNLLRFIFRHHFLILFLLIESFSLFLLFSTNPYQKVLFYSLSHRVSGRMSARVENFKDYLSLHDENQKLAEENARLYNRLRSSFRLNVPDSSPVIDTLYSRRYLYLTSRVINNTVNKQFNYITLDRGSNSGIEPDMAVINSDGIVGIVKSVTENYAGVMSVLNRGFTVSGKIRKNGYYGPVNWSGKNTGFATLIDIPHHVVIAKGDTIVTSGFGGVFPEGYLIGIVEDFRLKGGNYYEINVRLSNDYRKLSFVQVIKNITRQEIDSLETTVVK